MGKSPSVGPTRAWLVLRCVLLTVGGVVGFVATYGVAVRTARGQFLDLLAMSGQAVEAETLVRSAETLLGTISIVSVALMLIGIFVVGVIRKRKRAGLIVSGVVGGAIVSAELLKRVLLSRPVLVRASASDLSVNTLPSGHSTIAMCVAVSLVLLVPKRFQFAAAAVGTPYAVGIGVATVVAHWHRPSDVVAAWFVVAAWTFAGLVLLAGTGSLKPDEPAAWGRLIRPGLLVLVVLTTWVLLITTLIGLTAHLPRIPADQHRATVRSAFAFGFSLASIAAVAASVMGAVLWVLRDSRLVVPPAWSVAGDVDPSYADVGKVDA